MNTHTNLDQAQIRQSTAFTLEQMRKRNYHINGRGVYEILKQVREIQKVYQLTNQQLLRGFPELF